MPPSVRTFHPPHGGDEHVFRSSLRRRWVRILPAAFITYSLAYLDRANFGFGAAAGMSATLHLTGNRTSLLGSLFFLGYFAFQVPGVMLARRYSARRTVALTLFGWGVLASLTGVLRQFWLLAADRLLLGVMESMVFPSMLFLLTHWFTRAERSRANAVLMLGSPVTVLWMSAITGFLIQTFGWQRTFIFEGLPAIVWAVAWMRIVRDEPSSVAWLLPADVASLEVTLRAEQATLPSVDRLRSAFARPDVVLLCIQYFCWSLGVYGFVLWLPTIVREGSSLSIGNTGLLSAVPYVAAVVGEWTVSWVSDRRARRSLETSPRRETLIWPFLFAAGAALMGSFLLAGHSFALAFACLVVAAGCMYAPYGPFFAIIPERLPRNVSGEVLALVNSAGALGGFVGTYLVGLLQSVTGNSRAGFLLMSLSLIASAVLILGLDRISPASSMPLRAGAHAA